MSRVFSTIKSLHQDISASGVDVADGLFVHASLKSIGNVVGGARAVVGALFDAVGESGLIAMPGFSSDAYFPDFLDPDVISLVDRRVAEHAVLGFDPLTSPTSGMGAIAETFRTWPGTLRSSHPCVSICLHGDDADHYVAPHRLDWATGPDTPLGRLRNRPRMKVLLIGVGWNRCTALHSAETLADHRRLKTRRFKADPSASSMTETLDVADDLDRLFPAVGQAFEASGAVRIGRIGAAQSRLCSLSDLITFARDWIDGANQNSGDFA